MQLIAKLDAICNAVCRVIWKRDIQLEYNYQ